MTLPMRWAVPIGFKFSDTTTKVAILLFLLGPPLGLGIVGVELQIE